jgi:hypothetical protein
MPKSSLSTYYPRKSCIIYIFYIYLIVVYISIPSGTSIELP